MTRRPRGHLSDADRLLWEEVRRHVRPLDRNAGRAEPGPDPDFSPDPPPRPTEPPKAKPVARPVARRSETAPAGQVDWRTARRLRRGKLSPEARIDLHGKTLEAAHAALTRFILGAQAEGHRLVLVITGKGRSTDDAGPIPARRGLLREQVPIWLAAPPLGPIVAEVMPAHQRHGGGGAFYVALRRRR